jgi:hypothetical protein
VCVCVRACVCVPTEEKQIFEVNSTKYIYILFQVPKLHASQFKMKIR